MQRFLKVQLLLVAIATTALGAGPDEAASPLVMRSGLFTFFRKEGLLGRWFSWTGVLGGLVPLTRDTTASLLLGLLQRSNADQ